MHAHKSEQMKINLFGSHLPIDEVTKGSLHLVFEKKNSFGCCKLIWVGSKYLDMKFMVLIKTCSFQNLDAMYSLHIFY